jgi:hypothetical protein
VAFVIPGFAFPLRKNHFGRRSSERKWVAVSLADGLIFGRIGGREMPFPACLARNYGLFFEKFKRRSLCRPKNK